MLIAALTATLLLAPQQPAAHDRAFWQSIKAHDFAVPAGMSAAALSTELGALLGSEDPVLRDELAYEALAAWIVQKRVLTPAEIRPLMAAWTANLQRAVGTTGDNSVLLRSFSALALSLVAARDSAEPLLTPAEHAMLLNAALKYLDDERDLRGFDDHVGWIHATAHTADLIKFLARSPHLTVTMQHDILNAIARKMRDASVVFTFGEDERLARTLGSLMIRTDFDLAAFRDWVTSLSAPDDGVVTVARLRARQNSTNLLSKLAVLLARQPTLPPLAESAKAVVLAAIKF